MEPELRQLARAHTKEAIARLVWWMKSDNPKASPFAAKELLNRGWGQAPQYHEHDGDSLDFTTEENCMNYRCSGCHMARPQKISSRNHGLPKDGHDAAR
jgi:hypothetical protein